ncbi:MAG: hypothetical protein V4617_15115 [Gemmatimonadota bacterium]
MATTTPSRKSTAPLNLAALVAPLPPVILPNESEHALVFTAHAAQLFRTIRHLIDAVNRGETINDLDAEDTVDECLVHVLPTATPDDLASLGTRLELKLSILTAASGQVDAVMHALEEAAAAGKAKAVESTPDSTRDMTSAT